MHITLRMGDREAVVDLYPHTPMARIETSHEIQSPSVRIDVQRLQLLIYRSSIHAQHTLRESHGAAVSAMTRIRPRPPGIGVIRMGRTIDTYPLERLREKNIFELHQRLMRDLHIRAYEEQVRVMPLVRHSHRMVHHSGIEHIRQIDRVAIARIGTLAAVRIYNMTPEIRTKLMVEELRIGRFMIIEDTKKNLTCLHCVFGLVCFCPAIEAG